MKKLLTMTLMMSCGMAASTDWVNTVSGKGREVISEMDAQDGKACIAGQTQGGNMIQQSISAKGLKTQHDIAKLEQPSAWLACYDKEGKRTAYGVFKSDGMTAINDVVMGDLGQVYLAGTYVGNLSVPNNLLVQSGHHSKNTQHEGVNAFVAQYNGRGQLTWVKTMVNDTGVQAWRLAHVADDQGVILQGVFSQFVLFENNLLTGKALKNHFITRWDGDGQLLWKQSWPMKSGQVSAGGVSTDGNHLVETFNEEQWNQNKKDVVVVMRNIDNGHVEWHHRIGGKGVEMASNPIVSVDGGSHVLMSFQDQILLPDGQTTIKTNGSSDLLVMEFDAKGLLKNHWQHGMAGAELAHELIIEPRNNRMLVAMMQMNEINQATYQLISKGPSDLGWSTVQTGEKIGNHFSIQSMAFDGDQLFYGGVLFPKKGKRYTNKNKTVQSIGKSDVYLGSSNASSLFIR